MLIIKKKNIKIILWKKFFKINKNYIKNFKIVFEIKNLFKKKILIILNPLNSSHHFKGVYKEDVKNLGWWDKIIKIFKNFKIINISEINSSYGSTNNNSFIVFKYKRKNNFIKFNYNNLIKLNLNILKKIKIKKIHISIGSSLGGIKNFIFNIFYFKKIKFFINIASYLKISLKNRIKNKQNLKTLNLNNIIFKKLFYNYEKIKNLKIIRNINNENYISKKEIKNKIKNIIKKKYKFKKYKKKIFKYLNYKSNKFVKYFSINYYTNNLKFFKNLKIKLLEKKNKKIIIINFKNDKKFNKKGTLKTIKIFLKIKKNIILKIINSEKGHDDFLLKNLKYIKFLNNIKISE